VIADMSCLLVYPARIRSLGLIESREEAYYQGVFGVCGEPIEHEQLMLWFCRADLGESASV